MFGAFGPPSPPRTIHNQPQPNKEIMCITYFQPQKKKKTKKNKKQNKTKKNEKKRERKPNVIERLRDGEIERHRLFGYRLFRS